MRMGSRMQEREREIVCNEFHQRLGKPRLMGCHISDSRATDLDESVLINSFEIRIILKTSALDGDKVKSPERDIFAL
jgi:hypothetical protein